jgi:hypothetical protein
MSHYSGVSVRGALRQLNTCGAIDLAACSIPMCLQTFNYFKFLGLFL